jgi:hypothetical protein
MTEIRLLAQATQMYGSALGKANRPELVAILSAASLELECRHIESSAVSRELELIHDLTMSASDDDILTLAIAAAIRLRLPNTEILTPLIPAIAA